MFNFTFFFLAIWGFCLSVTGLELKLGVDCLFETSNIVKLRGKKLGLITNQTGVDSNLSSTIELFLNHDTQLIALFAPEHGLYGLEQAGVKVEQKNIHGLPVYSLYGATRRVTSNMLQGIDLLIFDIQDIGCRSYTYLTTLCYILEEAAKHKISVMVLDRPNPMGGLIVDGPMLEDKWRSYIGYINVPYCHGMTIGELACYFNQEYHIGCDLEVIRMKGWQRSMAFKDTKLCWIPTSPNIPEAETPLFYASTGILGELGIANIGIGSTLPFKVVGAPWINAKQLSKKLNAQKLPGIIFHPCYYRPLTGLYQSENCQGVLLFILDHKVYKPLSVQYMIIGLLKSLYREQFTNRLKQLGTERKKSFCKANGNEYMLKILNNEEYVAWKLIGYQFEDRQKFLTKRSAYLLY
ncbi:exo-beta-N-acetylmuramidase NamZ family protein [Candidatus Rhabdochlamydia porcellionis]|jgi:uncharacterized protein YbbC (DUF1343 family)|uniref:DUF1343 domain-containing protein n=1 Tax=Candidatus Rhabdochlamydia porcellionis TaxID=225148 RepID=A0ABX8Z164_9BACT|nr:DUF1343 domain-containing protein [Candidatus Rhabdochlamydia porcellionis]QZA59412.1 Protein of unknown function (DUF1343) [Candidatus Rhabdochlamydia porcellionis]